MKQGNEVLLRRHRQQQLRIATELHWLIHPAGASQRHRCRTTATGEVLSSWKPFIPQLFLLIAALLPFAS